MQENNDIKIKNDQRKNWNGSANTWNHWWNVINKAGTTITSRLFEMTKLGPGQKVLDIATGTGEPAKSAALLVGTEGFVLATDMSKEMLSYAKKRTANLSNIEFLEKDADKLDLKENSFDVVLSRWGFMFLTDLETTLLKIHNSLRSGGYIGASVWDVPYNVPMISLASGVIAEELNAPPPPLDAPGPFKLADSISLAEKFKKAGFANIKVSHVTVPFRFSSMDSYIQMSKDFMSDDFKSMMQNVSEIKREQVWQKVTKAANSYKTDDGEIFLPSQAICIAAEK